ncbi:LysR family transcriptional regulator [Nocardiopsis dassonvillei]|uniref:LysR family transcriptional regulator n=1 Tax=Nocardiopsis dassonvillei TaxID=2014 RepID=UPI003F567C47
MDIEAVRTFVAVAEAGRFQDAAADLRVSQQAVSKRIAGLERSLGAVLFTRTARGARLTPEGGAFLPHAREVLRAVDRAASSVRPGARPLRVDVLSRRIAPAAALHRFHRAHPGAGLDVVALPDADAGTAAAELLAGRIDATFRAAADPPAGVTAERVLDDPLQLLAGPRHPLARAASLRPSELAGHRIWIPGIRPGTEWSDFYDALARAFDLGIDAAGPNFGSDAMLDTIAESATVATLVCAGDRYVWPESPGLRRIPLTDPVPVYPHSLLFRTGDPHPVLALLRRHLAAHRPPVSGPVWEPWA